MNLLVNSESNSLLSEEQFLSSRIKKPCPLLPISVPHLKVQCSPFAWLRTKLYQTKLDYSSCHSKNCNFVNYRHYNSLPLIILKVQVDVKVFLKKV